MTATITRESPVGFDETLSRLNVVLAARGLKVFARIDHAANAREVGLYMPLTTVVIFGNARGGTPLMLAEPDVALDLPLRILLREVDGRTLLRLPRSGSSRSRIRHRQRGGGSTLGRARGRGGRPSSPAAELADDSRFVVMPLARRRQLRRPNVRGNHPARDKLPGEVKRHRPRPQVALSIAATSGRKPARLGIVLHPFGDRQQAHAGTHRQDRLSEPPRRSGRS